MLKFPLKLSQVIILLFIHQRLSTNQFWAWANIRELHWCNLGYEEDSDCSKRTREDIIKKVYDFGISLVFSSMQIGRKLIKI